MSFQMKMPTRDRAFRFYFSVSLIVRTEPAAMAGVSFFRKVSNIDHRPRELGAHAGSITVPRIGTYR
jgi:hypothetical protein